MQDLNQAPTKRNTMPISISTVPKKRVTKSKKQEDAARVYKNNTSGPGPDPNAPQPPFPDSDGTDNDVEVDHVTAPPTGSVAVVGEDTTPKGKKNAKGCIV